MKILITGASGQLGRELARQGQILGMDAIETDVLELDITVIESVSRFITTHAPDVVFNTAAWTAVDDAESHEQEVFSINSQGAGNVATVCGAESIPLVHYSTNYVFDGTKKGEYSEIDSANPINVYGRSKSAAEELVAKHCSKHLILRTSWVFSEYGNNFVKTILRLARERSELDIVSDQFGKPTSAIELARVSLDVVSRCDGDWGIYHVAQPNSVSWYEFAVDILDSARAAGVQFKIKQINAIKSAEYSTEAARPSNSVLGCSQFENTFEAEILDWHDALDSVIGGLHRDGFFA